MRTRVITALLVFALSGWTQAFALSDSQGAQPVAPVKATHTHSCCPGLHGSHIHPMVAPAVPASLPCGGQHSCCFARDSNHPVTLTATARAERPDSRIASFEAVEMSGDRGSALALVSQCCHTSVLLQAFHHSAQLSSFLRASPRILLQRACLSPQRGLSPHEIIRTLYP